MAEGVLIFCENRADSRAFHEMGAMNFRMKIRPPEHSAGSVLETKHV